MFARDAVSISQAAKLSPDVMANAIIFAIVTANAPLRSAVNTMLWLRTRDIATVSYANLTVADRSYMGNGLHTAKLAYVQNVWATRNELHLRYLSMGHLDFWNLLLDTVPGLGMVKAAFAVQMLYNKLGCLDVHNLRELGIAPSKLSGKTAAKRALYLDVQSGKTSEQWWNDWCDFIAKRYPGQFDSGDYVSRLHALAVVGV